MPSTRTSARLAKATKAKGKRVKATTNDVDDVKERDDDYEQAESEVEEKEPPRKRQRSTAKPTKAVARKKQVRGKQGRLAGLVNMPIDIFTEVASHLLPGDIISLARSNKFFRNLLMHRSAIHIWHGAMKNVEGLPPCPSGMSEPHFLALLFSKTCSMCGATARMNMDAVLLVRLCGACRDTSLMPLSSVPMTVMHWALSSGTLAPQKRRAGEYTLRDEVSSLLNQYEERKLSTNKTAFQAWTLERREIMEARRAQALVLVKFLASLEWDREQELGDLKEARHSEVKRRLAELGWAEKDMEFGYWSTNQKAWRDLVLQPKPLTDRIWTNIQPKLIPLLEINRDERVEAEREERKIKRKHRLQRLFQDIKTQSSPVLELKAQNPVPQMSGAMQIVPFAHRDPFPDFAHALKWPLMKNLHETDSSVDEMEANFLERRDEILALITAWKDTIQSPLANRLREAYASKGKDVRPTISISNGDSDPLANVSDDLKLLLRADSFFYRDGASNSKRPLSYSNILMSEGLNSSPSIYYGFPPPNMTPNMDKYHWYPEAHEAAQQLLADVDKPDTPFFAMNIVSYVFVCGRCHDNQLRNWEDMVQHYIDQKQLHAKVHENEEVLSEKGIIYNDIHGPASPIDLPMIMYHAAKAGVNNGFGRLQICKVCEKIPGIKAVFSMQGGITQHLRDVHGITDAKAEEHYAPQNAFSSGLLGAGIYDDDDDDDGYDSGDSYYMGHGCSCPYHSMLSHFHDDDDDDIYGSGHIFYDDEDEDEFGDGYSDEDDYWW